MNSPKRDPDRPLAFADDKHIVVTGGTGSFGRAFIRALLASTAVRRVVVVSRDELKQYEMNKAHAGDDRLHFRLGDVRDPSRLRRTFEGADMVVHAGALKQVDTLERNPFEAVRTNIEGTQNVIDAAIAQGVPRVVSISTDKASSPVNVYGATKFVAERLVVAANGESAGSPTRLSVVRYGNVMGSRGSVVPRFRELAKSGELPITDERMTRFWLTLSEAIAFVGRSAERMRGGEIFVPKIPSVRVVDLARAVAPEASLRVIGIRPGEKLHEEMVSETDARTTVDQGDHFVIQPTSAGWCGAHLEGARLEHGAAYRSDTNSDWLSVEEIRALLDEPA